MALGTPTLRLADNAGSGATSFESDSFSVTSGDLVLVWVSLQAISAPSAITYSANGLGISSFTELCDITAGVVRAAAYWAIATSSTSGTITFTFTGGETNRGIIQVVTISGADQTTPVGTPQTTVSTSGTTLTVTLASIVAATTSVVFGGIASENDDSGVSPGTGFTELSDVASIAGFLPHRAQVQYDYGGDGSAVDTTCDWSGTATNKVGFAVEVFEAVAGGGDPEGSLLAGKLIRGGLLRGGVLTRAA